MHLPIDPVHRKFALSPGMAAVKRGCDLFLALLLLPLLLPAILVLTVLARVSTGEPGIFRQQRIGLFGLPFTLYKIRSMKSVAGKATNVTTARDPRITPFGSFIRRWKLDEFPQIFNVLSGDMSFVGPRPDVEDVFTTLAEESCMVLCVRPGITGPASIAFRNEEELLAKANDPETYNREVVFPAKTRANLEYIRSWSLAGDIRILIKTFTG